MIHQREKTSRKVLRFPTIFVKSNNLIQNNDEIDEALLENSQQKEPTHVPPSKRHNSNTRLCFSERKSRPKPEREWSPMSNREPTFRNVENKYGRDGLYSKSVNKLYDLLTRQNSIILPPVQTSKRIRNNLYDDSKLKEKRYIMNNVFSEGKMARFARDQCYLPSVYSQYLNCKTCKKSYVNNKYIEEYKRRNQRIPNCLNSVKTRKVHFCDVLGKRCCATCIEAENRQFSKTIEEKVQSAYSESSSSIMDLCPEFC